ncbi:hypothetical protein [Nitrosomonas sp. Is37]|uniref:hypothetical protein n=1 Tax=Nitrosomonas sp. Is37 TaxID=3080535 RepID=UPI00294B4C51|nr:hypothetical protein [Nitrosomonas sp. Is37]MDV6345402.1 hypothetical protein [Nitrosomonas sp. Is37]
MSNNLKSRLDALEQHVDSLKKPIPALVIFAPKTAEEARTEFKQQHGYDYPADGTIIRIVTVDASREGKNREVH